MFPSFVLAPELLQRDASGFLPRHTRRREVISEPSLSPPQDRSSNSFPRALFASTTIREPSSFQIKKKPAMSDDEFRISRIHHQIASHCSPYYYFKKLWSHPSPLIASCVMLFILVTFTTVYLDSPIEWSRMFRAEYRLNLPDLLPRIQSLEERVERTAKALQVQVSILGLQNSELEQRQKSLEEAHDATGCKLEQEIPDLKRSIGHLDDKFTKLFNDAAPIIQEQVLELVESMIIERDREISKKALSLEDIRITAKKLIESELAKHSADGIGLPDFALSSAGGRVVAHSYALFSKFGGKLGRAENTLREGIAMVPGFFSTKFLLHPMANNILMPRSGTPGNCLPLKGSKGSVDVSLGTAIFPDAVSIDHIDKSVAFDISSAPRRFQIFGAYVNHESGIKASFKIETGETMLLGEFEYDVESSPPIQTFWFNDYSKGKRINYVSLKVLSNQGNPDFTCIYRLRVHGRPSAPLHSPVLNGPPL